MPTLEFRHAVRDALDEELARDERVIFFGEDVAKPGGVFATTPACTSATARSASSTPRSPSWRSPDRRSARPCAGCAR